MLHADKGKRTSQVSRRLLNALKFAAPSDGRLRAMPVTIPKGPVDRVVVNLNDSGIGFAGPKSAKGCARIACREPLGICTVEDELVKAACAHLYYSWHRFRDQVLGPEIMKGLAWGVKRVLGGSTRFSKCFEISQAPTEEVCGVFQCLLFS